jgi:hypothetical protein
MKYQKIKELGLNPERVHELVNGIEKQRNEVEMEYHKLQMNHEVMNND